MTYREDWITAAWTLMQSFEGQLTRRRFMYQNNEFCIYGVYVLKGHMWETLPESTVKMAAKALSLRPSMTFPKWQTSMDMRMPPVASRRMYRHSATMHSHSTPAEKSRACEKRHACVGGGRGGGQVNGVGGVDRTERMDEWRRTKKMARRAWCRWTTEPAADLHSVREDKVEDRRWPIQGRAQRCVMKHQILRFKCKPRCIAT